VKLLAQVVTTIVLAIYSFYTVGELYFALIQPARVVFPLVALGLSIAVLHYRVPRWLLFLAIGLNALFAAAAIFIILFFSPPLWWTVLVGLGACVGTATLNVVAISREISSRQALTIGSSNRGVASSVSQGEGR
jgi:hypothetical protein